MRGTAGGARYNLARGDTDVNRHRRFHGGDRFVYGEGGPKRPLRVIRMRYRRTEDHGEIFDQMDMQLEIIASMTGMEGVFKLRGADIYEVLEVSRLPLIQLPG